MRAGVPRVLGIASLARSVAEALTGATAPGPASIGLILADDAELATLNERHMGHQGPTDVLSFPLLEAAAFPAHPGRPAVRPEGDGPRFRLPPGRRAHLGDIVVSVERAIAQAESGSGGQTTDMAWTPAEELRLLVVHGTLHVCGWDHADDVEGDAMRALERSILATGS